MHITVGEVNRIIRALEGIDRSLSTIARQCRDAPPSPAIVTFAHCDEGQDGFRCRGCGKTPATWHGVSCPYRGARETTAR